MGKISLTYSTATVSGGGYVGGFTGGTGGEPGEAEKSGSFVGNFISGKIENCYSTSLADSESGGEIFFAATAENNVPVTKTPEQMRNASSYTNWDFTTIWEIQETVTLPSLRGITKPDSAPPEITYVKPGNNEAIGLNPVIKVFAEDMNMIFK
jgi:outer membrane protein assembly factor BamA